MKITRVSMLSGKAHTLDLPVTQDQLALYEKGFGKIQDIFPRLSPDQREFIKSGITSEEWDATFTPEDE